MIRYLLKRIASGVALLCLVSTLTFMMVFGATENVARNILGENATADQVKALNSRLGLDRPLPVQFGDWVSHAVRGDLGPSWTMSESVTSALASRLPVTL